MSSENHVKWRYILAWMPMTASVGTVAALVGWAAASGPTLWGAAAGLLIAGAGGSIMTAKYLSSWRSAERRNSDLQVRLEDRKARNQLLRRFSPQASTREAMRGEILNFLYGLRKMLEVDIAGWAVAEEPGGQVEWRGFTGNTEASDDEIRDADGGIVELVLQKGEVVGRSEFWETVPDEAQFPLLRREDVKSVLAAPINIEGIICGALVWGWRKRRDFCDEDISLLKGLADRIGAAWNQVRLLERTSQLESLQERAGLQERFQENMGDTFETLGSRVREAQSLLLEGEREYALAALDEMVEVLKEGYDELRLAAFEVAKRGRASTDFVTLLTRFARSHERRHGVSVNVEFSGHDFVLTPQQEMQIIAAIRKFVHQCRHRPRSRRITISFQSEPTGLLELVIKAQEGEQRAESFDTEGWGRMKRRIEGMGGTLLLLSQDRDVKLELLLPTYANIPRES